jgi:hypothetical protein
MFLGRLDTLEFVPFRSAIASNVSAVMSAHTFFRRRAVRPYRDAGAGVLAGMLRDSLHFSAIVTDHSTWAASSPARRWRGSGPRLLAGADILLQPADPASSSTRCRLPKQGR